MENKNSLKFLVIGCGSIGMRHIRNLIYLNAGSVYAFDISADKRSIVEYEYGIRTFESLEEALEESPDAVLICTPPAFHIEPAISAVNKNCHIFIEKPVSGDSRGLDDLSSEITKRNLVSLVACNMRFYHGISKIKELISNGTIGQIYCARVIAGHYLPDWHPELDYRNSYSAKESMGGGVLLDGIHEIDYLCWLLGDVEDLFCFSGKYSQLDIDTEDMAEMLLKFKSGAVGEIHLDYLQRVYGRSCQIIGEKGTILWDFNTKKVSLYSVEKKEWQYFDEPEGYDVNQMYIEEMKYFIRCIDGKEKSFNDINEGIRILNIVIAAKESAAEGKLIGTGL